METIDIQLDMREPLPKGYYQLFEVLSDRKLKNFNNKKSVNFLIYKVTRKDNTDVYIIADIIDIKDVTKIIKQTPHHSIMHSEWIKKDSKKMVMQIKNGNYVMDKLINPDKSVSMYPIFSMLAVDQINALTRCIGSTKSKEVLEVVNDWLANGESLYDYLANPDA